MPKFKYTARDRSGKASAGVLMAADEAELRRTLRMNDLYLTQFKGTGQAASQTTGPQTAGFFDPKVTLQDMVIATRQLGTTVRAGLPIMEALDIVGSQSSKPALRFAFKDMELTIAEGQYLSVGMRKHPKLFNNLVLSLVEAGEIAGTLDQTLEVAAEQLDREHALKQRVKAATLYPKLVIVACAGTIAAMLTLVVPVFANVYKDLHAKLPAATTLLITVSDFVLKYWLFMLVFGIAVNIGYKKYAQNAKGRRRLDIVSLKIPIIGPIMRKIAIARFVQTLAGALKGGVHVLRSMSISAQTAGNTVIRDAVTEAAKNVRDGSTIAEELEKTGEFPLMVTRMIAAGEATGNVDQMLEEINRFYDRDIEYAVDQLARMIEPVMTVVVGSIVLVVLLALYMPIFSLGNAVLGKK